MNTLSRQPGYRRRGSAYLAVLGVATIVAVISLSSLVVSRLHHRTVTLAVDAGEARLSAGSGIEAAIGGTVLLSNWRELGEDGNMVLDPFPIGRGTCSLTGVDEIDGDISDDSDQPVLITATAQVGSATFSYGVTAEPPPLDCLAVALHAVGGIGIESHATLTVEEAPVFCSYASGMGQGVVMLFSDATVVGDVAADSVVNGGTITGTITEDAYPKEEIPSSVIDFYRDSATSILQSAIPGEKIDKTILSHNQNAYGAVDADGLYYIDMEDKDLTIEQCRIEGTLVIQLASNKKLEVKKGVHWEPHRPDYPALIVVGGEYVKLMLEYPLDEHDADANFNPPGMPYEDQEDTDEDDVYPSVIKGLIHIDGCELRLEKVTRVEGAVIAHGIVVVKDTVTVVHDANLASNPPKRYRASRLNAVPGTWRRVTSP